MMAVFSLSARDEPTVYPINASWWPGDLGFQAIKVIHKEYSRFLNQFFPTPCLYHKLNMIIYTSYIII